MRTVSLIATGLALSCTGLAAQVIIPIPGRPDVSHEVYDTHVSSNFIQVHLRFTDSSGSQHEVWAFQCDDGWGSLLHREAGVPNKFPLPYPPAADEPLYSNSMIYTIARVSCQTEGFDTSGWGA